MKVKLQKQLRWANVPAAHGQRQWANFNVAWQTCAA